MSFEDYLDGVPEERVTKIDLLIGLIRQNFPNAKASMKYKMPTFETDTGWVAIANQKNYVSLYTCSAEHLEEFKQKFPSIKAGKGCINFTDSVEIPEKEVEQVIKSAMTNGAHN